MTIAEAQVLLDAEILTCEDAKDYKLVAACGADLMSDVLAFGFEKSMLLTGLVNGQVIRTAEMLDIKAVVFVRGKNPTAEILELATEKHMVVLTTELPMYTACGRLYAHGLRGGGEDEAEV